MKTVLAFAALLSLAALPVAAHPVDAYGIFWKDPNHSHSDARQSPHGEIWRFAFVSKFRW